MLQRTPALGTSGRISTGCDARSVACMSNTTEHPTTAPEAPDALSDSATRAEAWAGEPFLHSEEDPSTVLASGTARRRALDEALAEIESGRDEPSSEWKVRFGF